MTRLKSEFEVGCPCCGATLVIDRDLGRVIEHREPPRGDRPNLSDAQRILADEAARREAIFEQSVTRRENARRCPFASLRGGAETRQAGADYQTQARLRSRLSVDTRDQRNSDRQRGPAIPSAIIDGLAAEPRPVRSIALAKPIDSAIGADNPAVASIEQHALHLPHVLVGQPPVVVSKNPQIDHGVTDQPAREVDVRVDIAEGKRSRAGKDGLAPMQPRIA